MIFLIALQALLSISLPLHKQLLTYCPPFFLAGSRLLLGGTLLLLYHFLGLIRYRRRMGISMAIIRSYALGAQNLTYLRLIVIGVYAKHILRSWSLQYMSVVKMAFLFNCTPFIAAAVSFLLRGERISFQQLFGMILGFMGVAPLFWVTSEAGYTVGELVCISFPDWVLLLAIVAHCYGMQSVRTLMCDQQQSASFINGIRMFGGGILCMVTAFWTEGLFPVTQPAPFIVGLFFLVVCTNIFCHGWYLRYLQTHSVTLLALADFLEPLVIACYGWAFFGETITWQYLWSAVLAVLGLYFFYHGECKKSMLY